MAQIWQREDPKIPGLDCGSTAQAHQGVETLTIRYGQVVHAETREYSAATDSVVRGP